MNGLQVAQARGKMLGGSSGINYMQFTFASRVDLNDWEKLGNTGWNYESMAPYYKKFEDFQGAPAAIHSLGTDIYINEAEHGHNGPINASLTPFYLGVQKAWPLTLANMGLAPNGDPRDGVSLGGYTNPMVITKGSSHRSFAGNSYWKPYSQRPNLHTITKAVVSNIVFSDNRDGDLVATGLNFTVNGTSYTANSSKEVIISGGTMKSPQMLELSGIGDAELLKSFGIESLIDNPNVGENLQDHPQCGVSFVVDDGGPTFDDRLNKTLNAYWTEIFDKNGTGLLAGGVSQTAQLSWTQILGPEKKNRPSELVASNYNGSDGGRPGLKAQLDLTAKKLLDPNESAVQTGGNGPWIGGFVTHPFSRGYIHIQSADPDDKPKFDPRYLSHPLDYEVLKDLQFFSLNVSTTAPLSSHLKGNGTVLAPPVTVLNETTVRDFINTYFITGWHVVGSCPMMPRDQGGVLDPRLRVYGTKNVRVVDASIVPLHVRGNTVSLTYAIAERGADLIKEDMNGTVNGTAAGTGGAQPFTGGTSVGFSSGALMLLLLLFCAAVLTVL